MSAKPEGQQVEALRLMREWFKNYRNGIDGTPQFFYLAGFAGAGKTFLVKHFLAEEDLDDSDVRLLTFMARSALVLGRASGLAAQTIHSAIYEMKYIDGRDQWVLDRHSDVKQAKLLVLDECSMVGEHVFTDIMSFKRPVLILGDPGQFEPIRDVPFFQTLQPDYFLTEIRRQAQDNPIIRLSMLAREGQPIPYGDFGKARKVSMSDMADPQEWISPNIMLTTSHKWRHKYNAIFRQVLGYSAQSPYPVAGDRLICMKNKHALGLANGTLGTALHDAIPPEHLTSPACKVDFQFETGEILNELPMLAHKLHPQIGGHGRVIEPPEYIQRKCLHFEYGYAITAHKALGSQFEDVLVFDSQDVYGDYNKWLYVAVTRAVEKLTIIC